MYVLFFYTLDSTHTELLDVKLHWFLGTNLQSKAAGPDGISSRMLKCTAASTAPSIMHLFNMSILSGTIPKEWKISSVVPIPKGKCSNMPSNYRPNSLRHLFQWCAISIWKGNAAMWSRCLPV